jgi:transposase
MEVMFDRVAGLDVGKESVTVCVRTPGSRRGRHSETRTFKTMTGSLRVMRDWLVESGVTIAAMESTSAYWKPPFYCLEQALVELDQVIVAACRPWQHQIELLQTIPGVGPKVAETIVAETGADMTRFPTAAHLAAWAGVAPAMNESAGRQMPAGKRHGTNG